LEEKPGGKHILSVTLDDSAVEKRPFGSDRIVLELSQVLGRTLVAEITREGILAMGE
jgi:hypothetical protein